MLQTNLYSDAEYRDALRRVETESYLLGYSGVCPESLEAMGNRIQSYDSELRRAYRITMHGFRCLLA